MLKKMKIKKFSFFKKLIYTLIFGFSSVCLLGAWTIDSNGNLQSDNLFNNTVNYTYTGYGVEVNVISNECILNGTSNGGFYQEFASYTLQTGTYSYKQYILSGGSVALTRCRFGLHDSDNNYILLGTESGTFTLNQTTTFNIMVWWGESGLIFNNTKLGFMLNSGSTALSYEPYGTWYSQSNYETLQNEITQLNNEINDLESQILDLQNEYDTLLNNIGTISYDISQYSVSVGSVPNPPSFNYTKHQDLSNNFSTIGYLNLSEIYTNYIQSGNNNSIYIITPQSNLLTFDMVFNYTTQPNTMIKTTLTLPNGDIQQFAYSSTDFNYKGEWTLANLVGSSSIGVNYDINDISYKDVIITYENVGNNLSDIKLGSNNGYNTGFNSGYNTALDRINELTTELNEKTTNLQQVTDELNAKTIQYNNLYNLYQNLSNEPLQLNFQSLLWNIASTPFEVFKTMWNFDFLGFNIAQFITR